MVQNLWDDMEDLHETSTEVQDILSRSYGVPEEFDEADLEEGWGSPIHKSRELSLTSHFAELAALGDEVDLGEEESTPSYLQAVGPSIETTLPTTGATASAPQHTSPAAAHDPFALPSVPQGELANW